jgi:hypothetical protein
MGFPPAMTTVWTMEMAHMAKKTEMMVSETSSVEYTDIEIIKRNSWFNPCRTAVLIISVPGTVIIS